MTKRHIVHGFFFSTTVGYSRRLARPVRPKGNIENCRGEEQIDGGEGEDNCLGKWKFKSQLNMKRKAGIFCDFHDLIVLRN